MSGPNTTHFGFKHLSRGDSVADDDWQFGVRDRDTMDLLFWLLENHHHDAASSTLATPASPPSLELDQSAGVLPAGTPIHYVYTLVDARGVETLASPEATIVIPNAVGSPSAPTYAIAAGGSLLPGVYAYALSAYKDANTLETQAPNLVNIQLLAGGTWKVTFTLPTLPSGADGFNIYRRGPGQSVFHYLASIDMNVATPPSTYVDNGTVTEAADRGLPVKNTTNNQNSVEVSIPGATPVVPVGYTWRIYRTLTSGTYPPDSLLKWVVEETREGSGVITPLFKDLGYVCTIGVPPTSEFAFTNPTRVQFANAAEVQGVLPPANIVFRHIEEFTYEGTLATIVGSFAWLCPFTEAYITEVLLNLGKSSTPHVSSVIVDVNKFDSSLATPVWNTIFTTQPNRPRVLVGQSTSVSAVPDVRKLVRGDMLTVDIDQVGGGATPTDRDLLVQVVMYYKDTTATSIAFP